MCRFTDSINVGCFHIGNNNPQPSCMCYLTRSKTRQTPYLCTTLKNDRGEIGRFILIFKIYFMEFLFFVNRSSM
jgi:hypothetical protein